MEICLATHNAHKVEEIRNKLQGAVAWLSLADVGCTHELPETSATLEGNSMQKATYVFQTYGVVCLADDSGLEVDALGGAPGVHSAHYAGPARNQAANVQKLLHDLKPHANRRARFRTVLTLATPGGTHVFEGTLPGVITAAPRGMNGFGYDPVFQPEGMQKVLAELSLEEKNRISHRAQALQKLAEFLHLHG